MNRWIRIVGFGFMVGQAVLASAVTVAAETSEPIAERFTVVLMPDTQFYAARTPNSFLEQMQWIVDNRENLNIQMVIHLGDIIDGMMTDNPPLKKQWAVAKKAFAILKKARIPYTVLAGNHDLHSGKEWSRANLDPFRRMFPPHGIEATSLHSGCPKCTESNWRTFAAGGLEFLIINFEMVPPLEVLEEANRVIQEHPSHRVIVATHCYLGAQGKRYPRCDSPYSFAGAGANELWDDFIKRHSNIFMVVSGHISGSVYSHDENMFGATVHQILTDYQYEEELLENQTKVTKTGAGWLRILNFDPASNTVSSKVVSARSNPISELNASAYNSNPEHAGHAFEFKYDMTSAVDSSRFQQPLSYTTDVTVNSSTTGEQMNPSVAAGNMGHVVVWEEGTQRRGIGIRARIFPAGGGDPFELKINPVGRGNRGHSRVAMDHDGGFVVVWQDDADGSLVHDVRMRGFNWDGTERFGERLVQTDSNGDQRRPDVAMGDKGQIVVVWEGARDLDGQYDAYLRSFDAAGRPGGDSVRIDETARGESSHPVVAIDESSRVVVAWQRERAETGAFDVLAMGYDGEGKPRFAPVTVNVNSEGYRGAPCLGVFPGGSFAVAWEDDSDGNQYFEIMMRSFEPDGSAGFAERPGNTQPVGDQRNPAFAVTSHGELILAWEHSLSNTRSKKRPSIRARVFDGSGVQIREERKISDWKGRQTKPSLAVDHVSGRGIAVWQSDTRTEGDKNNVLVRMF